MKKILIIGQLPKEHGGNYTTGVANVIVNLLPFIPYDQFEKHLWASNIKKYSNKDIYNTKVYGINKYRLVFLFLSYFFKYPKRIITFKKYSKFGVKPLRNIIYEICIAKLINKIKPDVIHVHNIGFLPAVHFANNKNNTNILLTYHGVFYNDKYSIEQSLKKGIDIKKLFYNASQLINNFTVLTEQMKNDVVKYLNVKSNTIKVIPNGVGKGFYFNLKARLKLRKSLNYKDSDIVFISVGALTKRKNHIGAINFLKSNFNNFKYLIVGRDGDYKEELLEIINNHDMIDLIPYVKNSELYKYYSASDYFIMPSTQEGQSLVCLEAFASGLPVLINSDIKYTLGVPDFFSKYYVDVNLNIKNYKIPNNIKKIERDKLSSLAINNLGWSNSAKEYSKYYDN